MRDENSYIGSYYSDRERNRPSLGELITGMREDPDGDINRENEKPERKIMKEVGILFHVRNAREPDFDEVTVSNLSLHVDLDNEPLVWLGSAGADESISLLETRYGKSD